MDALEPTPEPIADAPPEPTPRELSAVPSEDDPDGSAVGRRAIVAPRRSGPAGTAIVLGSVALYATFILLPRFVTRSTDRVMTGAAVAVVLLAALLRERMAMHLALLLSLVVLWQSTGAPPVWPFYLAVPLLAYGASAVAVRRMRRDVGWVRRGRMNAVSFGLMAATVLVSSGALVLWVRLRHPDLTDIIAMMPAWSPAMLFLAGMVFSTVNAAMEEVVWRGVMLEALDSALGMGVASLVIQAASFGVAHIAGFPRGALGVAMAGTYGLMLGIIRRQTRGMLAPFLTHIAADATIFAILIYLIRHAH